MKKNWKTFFKVLIPIITIEVLIAVIFNLFSINVLVFLVGTTLGSIFIWFIILRLKGN